MRIITRNEITHLHTPNINVCFKVRINKNFSNADFESAVTMVEKRHPILKCVVKTNTNGEKVFADAGGVSIQFCSAKDWQAWRDETDNISFDFENEGLVKIAVIRRTDYTDIVILGHHVLGDGIGYLNLMNDFLKALDRELDDAVFEIPEKNPLKNKCGAFLRNLFASSLNKQWNKNKRAFTHADYLLLFQQYRNANPSSIYLAETKQDFLPKLKTICKTRGITVNEALATAFVRALQKQNGGKTIRLGCAASTRNDLTVPLPYHMGNCVTGILTEITNADDTPTKLREQLGNPKKRYQVVHLLDKLDESLIESVSYAAYGNYKNPVSQKLATSLGSINEVKAFGITNLGVYEFDGFSFAVDDVWFVNPAFPQNFLTVGIITVGGIVKFCLNYLQSEISEGQIEGIWQEVIKEVIS